MSTSTQCCSILRGKVYLTPAMCENGRGHGALWRVPAASGLKARQQGPGVFLGNSSRLDITQRRTDYDTPDNTGSGDGCYASILEGVDIALNVKCLNSRNVALALFGQEIKSGASQCVMNEDLQLAGSCLDCGDLIQVGCPMIDCEREVSIEHREPDVTQTLMPGIDYRITPTGVELMNQLCVSENGSVLISYWTAESVTTITPFKQGSIDVGLTYSGFDQVSGNPVVAQLYRMTISNSDVFSLINSEGFGETNLTARLRSVCIDGENERMRILTKSIAEDCGAC